MDEMIGIFKALSDQTRLRIVKLLDKGELCVCDIVEALDVVQSKASFHLAVLKDAGLLKCRKQGKWIHYSLNESDLFRRMLMVSVCDRVDGGMMAEDRMRLERLLKLKSSGPDAARRNAGLLAAEPEI